MQNGMDKTENYAISYVNGTLKVTPRDIADAQIDMKQTEYVYNEYRWKGRNYKGAATLLKSWDWYGHGSRGPIRDTTSLSDGRIATPSISG